MTRTKRLLVVGAGLVVIVAATLLANPYPRQLLFGPTIRGTPLCAWQDAFRHSAFMPIGGLSLPRQDGFVAKWRQWLGRGDAALNSDDFESLTPAEREQLFLSLVDDEDKPVRRIIAHELGGFDSPAALAGILRLLVDKDEDVRSTASLALANSEKLAPAAWPKLKVLLEHDDPELRALALCTMNDAGIHAADTLSCLIRLLDDPSPSVRCQSAGLLGSYRWTGKRSVKAAVPKLTERLRDEDARCRLEAAYALWMADHQTQGLAPVLVKELKNDDDKIRLQAVQYLTTMDKVGLEAWDHLLTCLTDQSANVRLAAIWALTIGGRKAVPVLVRCLQAEGAAPEGAMNALSAIGPDASEAVPALLAHVVAPANSAWSMAAIRALGEIKSGEAVPELVKQLASATVDIRLVAAEALGDIGPPARDAVPLLLPMLNDQASGVRCAAARALGKLGGNNNEVLAMLLRMADDPENDQVLAEAAYWLGPKAEKLVPALRRFLANKEHSLHRNAAPALGAVGAAARDAVPDLLASLKTSDNQPYIDYPVVEALGKIGHDAARVVPALQALLNEKEEQLQLHAIRALGRFGTDARTAVPALRPFLDSDSTELAEAAAAAILKIEPFRIPVGQAALPLLLLP